MCGIISIFSPEKLVDEHKLRRGMTALRHRGPDGQNLWISPEQTVGLGHTRLAIIGLQDGGQPISNEDGQVQIIVNGEFYDFERIRGNLQSKGHHFKTHSDAEIAVHLYEEYGTECLQYLRGEFAFVIWDQRRRRLFAARDRFGIKPLFYTVADGRLYIASESKALFAAGVKPGWDQESFFDAANLQYVLPHRTLFANVQQLQPGHYLLAEDPQPKTFCYWDFDYLKETRTDPEVDEASLIEEFKQLFAESVRLRLRADVPVCAHLSGGLDSSAIVGLAMQHSQQPITCFTVTFDESSYDELQIAQEMARQSGAKLQAVHVSQKDLIEQLPEAVYFSEGLAVNGHLPAKFILHKEISRAGFRVVLTGEGSDELVAGYPHLRSDLFKEQGRPDLLAGLHASNRASQGIMLLHGQSLPLEAVKSRLGYIPSFLEAKGSLGYKICSVLSDEFKEQYTGRDCYKELLSCFDVEGQLQGRNRVDQSLYIWSKTALANYILKVLGDGTEMSHAVEGRVPFLDHHLFEFARRLPLSMKIREGIEKYVLREAARPMITQTVYNRRKHPFVAPPVSTFCNPEVQAILQDILRSKRFAAVPFFDQRKMIAVLDRLPYMSAEDSSAMDPVLMTALSTAAFHEKFGL